MTDTPTGKLRYRFARRWFRPPCMVLQVEVTQRRLIYHRIEYVTVWRDVILADLPMTIIVPSTVQTIRAEGEVTS